MAEIRDKTLLPVVNIATTGDIILIVGSEKLHLRVQSLILKAASEYLCTLLRPNREEGHASLGLGLPIEVVLPEDDPTALRCICAILHHQIKLVPHTMDTRDVLRVAIAADKYGLVDALTLAHQVWLCPLNKAASDLLALAAAAFLFKNAEAFKVITKTLVLNYEDSYLTLWNEDVVTVLGERIFCKKNSMLNNMSQS